MFDDKTAKSWVTHVCNSASIGLCIEEGWLDRWVELRAGEPTPLTGVNGHKT